MLSFKQYFRQNLFESSVEDTLKAHLSHLEDLAIEEGKTGFAKFAEQVTNFTNYINGLQSKTLVNLKIDGSPAIFFGIDPREEYKDKFFIATKSLFSSNPNLIHSVEEVETYYGDADPQLKNILKTIFPYLEAGYDGSGKMYQSDLLFSPARPPFYQTINGQEYIIFKPQLIAYAILVDPASKLYKLASNAQVGLVVHRGFNLTVQGTRITPVPAGKDTTSIVLSLKKAGVFAESSNYSTIEIQLDPQLNNSIDAFLKQAQNSISLVTDEFDTQYINNAGLVGYLKQYLNEMVKSSGGIFRAAKAGEPFNINKFTQGFVTFINSKIDKAAATKGPRGKANAEAKKAEYSSFVTNNLDQFRGLIGATYSMIRVKNIFLQILSKVQHELTNMKAFIPAGDAFIAAPGEGHVLYIGDTPNQVKIVDRLDFSANNFKYGGAKARATINTPPTINPVQEAANSDLFSFGYFGGGFNPPHKGHFEAAKMAAQQNNEVYIVISNQERDKSGITTAKKVAIWSLYLPLLTQYKAKINLLVAEVSPVRTIYEHVDTLNNSPSAKNITVNLYTDTEDSGRYRNMQKYSENLAGLNLIPTPRLGSGTQFRAYLAAGSKQEIFNMLPQGIDKEAVWRILISP